MSRPLGILLLVLFQAFWLNVFLPGHTRGRITMPGAPAEQSAAAKHTCCATDTDADDNPCDPDQPSKSRAANCAVCAYAAHLTVAPPIDLAPRPTDLLCLSPDPRNESVTTLELVLAYLGRAPPQA